MDNQKPIRQEIDELKEALKPKPKTRKLRMRKMKVSKSRLKKGWIGVLRIGQNRNATPEKCQIEDSTYRTSDGTYHAFTGEEILFLNGRTKTPFLIQPEIKLNPIDLITGNNETRGQKMVQARMLKDTIKIKKPASKGIFIVIIIIVVGFILGKYVFKLF